METIYKVTSWNDYSKHPRSKSIELYYKTKESAINSISTFKSLYDVSNRNVINREWKHRALEDGGDTWTIYGYMNTFENGGYIDGTIYSLTLTPLNLLD